MFQKDDSVVSMASSNDAMAETRFKEFLDLVEENTARVSAPISSLRLVAAETPLSATAADEERDTAQNGTHLFITANDVPFVGVRDTAMASLYQRCGLMPTAITKLPIYEQAVVMNRLASYAGDDKFLACIVGGKLNAALSDGDSANSYRAIPQPLLYKQMRGVADALNKGGSINAFTGTWSYSQTMCRWGIDAHHTLGGKTYNTEIALFTSDTGDSAVRMDAALADERGGILPMADPINIDHRKKNAALDVLEAAQMLSAAADRGLQDLEDLQDIEIEHPYNCARRLAAKIGLPKKDSVEAIDVFFNLHPEITTMTAWELYSEVLGEIVNRYCQAHKREPHLQMRMRGNLLKAKKAQWARYDLAEPFVWEAKRKEA